VASRESLTRGPTTAISVSGVSKTFRLPHHPRTTFKEYFLHPSKRTTFEAQVALDNVSLDIGSGEFFGIIGGNGSGKSTLLKVIAQIYRQDHGTVSVHGLISPFIELGVGFNGELTARDNIKLNSVLLGLTHREVKERFDEIVAFAELERFVDQRLKNFSSGMQVRLAYSIAIQVDFDILLLDEVLAVGDERFQRKCFATFDRFREAGKTLILVTHDLSSVSRFCDRAALLESGRIAMIGRPDDVIDFYRSTDAGIG
jgi:ABC-type polysaccharide/polyol phosphate transport system ATPase subunit